jgi:hypothetical protein
MGAPVIDTATGSLVEIKAVRSTMAAAQHVADFCCQPTKMASAFGRKGCMEKILERQATARKPA